MSDKSRDAKQDCLRQIAQMRRTHGVESDWPALLGETVRLQGVLPVPPPRSDLSDPELYLDFLAKPSTLPLSRKSRAIRWRLAQALTLNPGSGNGFASRSVWTHCAPNGPIAPLRTNCLAVLGIAGRLRALAQRRRPNCLHAAIP